MTVETNPLLGNLGLPKFEIINAEHVEPAVTEMLTKADQQFAAIEANAEPTWNGLIKPLESLERFISATWGPVTHLIGVKNSEALRTAYQNVMPKLVAFGLKMSQSESVYEQLTAMTKPEVFATLNSAQKRVIENRIKSAELSGLKLTGEKRKRFNEIQEKLSQLSTQFSNNVLDATKAFELVVTNKSDLEGIPANFVSMWAENYKTRHPEATDVTDDTGPWSVTLDFASYEPFMRYCTNRKLRETLYKAFVTKASNGDFDNSEHIKQILTLRQEMAKLLGFNTYAELSVSSKMAETPDRVDALLSELAKASKPHALKEYNELNTFAKNLGLEGDVLNWDTVYYSEKLRKKNFDISDEELRPYFPLPKVLEGLFSLVNKIFGVTVKVATDHVEVWNKDIKYYDILNEKAEIIAGFYLDPYSRPADKRGGAWMDTCIDRGYENDKFFKPVAYLVCNGTPPSADKPSLLSFREVETLFHEFGHGLQHMLTKIDESFAAGINGVEWDAVELPSQFMENWCYHKPTLLSLTEHVETKAVLPDELFEKIEKARTFQSALAMVRQLQFSMVDMELHHRYDPSSSDLSVFAINQKIAKDVVALQPIPEDRFLCAFSHIFAGGYAAGYYSYKWAEVLSADAFSKFEEAGLDNDDAIKTVGMQFRETVLALGGSEHPMAVFKAFRGRDPQTEALLRHSGLSNTEAAV